MQSCQLGNSFFLLIDHIVKKNIIEKFNIKNQGWMMNTPSQVDKLLGNLASALLFACSL